MRLKGKTAVVTGGGTGIGAGCAVALADEGCRVIVSGRRERKLEEVVANYGGEGDILPCPCDVADRASVKSLFENAHQKLGRVDILVHSAGTNIPNRTMAEMQPADWDKVLEINTTGAYNCMYEALPEMRERKDGLIVLVSSIAGLRGSTLGGVAYSASKFAMSSLGLTVANECREEGVRVTNVYPGEVDTPILENRPVMPSPERRATMLQPEDLGAAVVMLAGLPPRAHVPMLVMKPTVQEFE